MIIETKDYRPLGRTGIQVSPLAIGAWQLGGPLVLDGKSDGHPDPGRGAVIDLIRRCGEAGVNLIDTAEQYAAGESERRVGEALRGQRDRWIISTKFGAQVGPGGERVNDVSARRLPLSLEGSLRRLGTDRIDIYLYHSNPDPAEAEGVADFLAKAKREGKIRAVGYSGNSLEIARMLLDLGCLDVIQFQSNLLAPDAPLRDFLAAHEVGGMVRGAMAGGRLSGKYFDQPPVFQPDDIRSNWFGPGSAAAFTRMKAFAACLEDGETMAGVALRYLWEISGTATILLGGKRWEDYATALAAWAQGPLGEVRREALRAVADQLQER